MAFNPAIQRLSDIPRVHAAERPHAPLTLFEGRVQTCGQFDENCNRVGNGLIAAGVKPRERIAYLDKNSDCFFEAWFGATKANAVMVPVNWRLAPAEIAYVINDAQAKVLFVGAPFYGAVEAIEKELKTVALIVALDGDHPRWPAFKAWRDANSTSDPKVPSEADDVAIQLYTSGTTGHPKGAMLTHNNFLGGRAQQAGHASLGFNEWTEKDVSLVAMPIFHIGGAGWGFNGLLNGAMNIIVREFTPRGALEAIRDHKITKLFMVPAAMKFAIEDPLAATTDFSSLKYMLYGASPIPLDLLRRAMDVFKCGFVQVYGMTETTGSVTYLPPEDHDPNGNRRMRSAGKPFPGVEVKIIDEEGAILPAETVGEICIRSTLNMRGYWNLDGATKKTLDSEGWLRTGDAGYLDADGYVYVHDRVKDMIVSGGENVYPAEVESAIFGHPAIADVAVIGVPDDKWGEAVKAMVVLKPGASATAEEIIQFARGRIAGFKCPKSVAFIEALPRNPSGKILKRELRSPFWEGRERQVN
ncbi:MAG: long-chain-fatty-acid--CoA ligase [Alphaproteobacteria bacterium]|nr:long-chain-fatty-acid--CoA ligase [Alphaproteobacteria bacterium]